MCTVRPEKTEKNCTCFVEGRARINNPREVAAPMAEMLVVKLLFNSIISMLGKKFITMDITNYYIIKAFK